MITPSGRTNNPVISPSAGESEMTTTRSRHPCVSQDVSPMIAERLHEPFRTLETTAVHRLR